MPKVSSSSSGSGDENKPVAINEYAQAKKHSRKAYNRKSRQSMGASRKKRRQSLGFSMKSRRHTMVGLVPRLASEEEVEGSDSNNPTSLLSAGLSTITSGNEESMTADSNASDISITSTSNVIRADQTSSLPSGNEPRQRILSVMMIRKMARSRKVRPKLGKLSKSLEQ